MCASYAPKPKVDTTFVDSTAVEEEIILDENGNPVIKERPAGHTEGETPAAATTEEGKKEKKKLSLLNSQSTSMTFNDFI